MSALVNVFHPMLSRSRVVASWARALQDAGLSVRDLYGRYPDGVVDPDEERAWCEEADVLIFVHPLHWYSAPWLMKRWIDEVLGHGWAYGGPDRLEGKSWLSIVSVGAGSEEYGPAGTRRYRVDEFLRPFERTAAFCRMRWVPPLVEFGGGYADEQAIADSSSRVVARVRALSGRDEPPAA
ncbi:MAG: NAD(P)H-dependent oxidoreductase [Fimbriimonadaceae bacterium]|nr:NAD(P)H-dependent oxidoreductase [Fimbriimonadaceae bacterium]